MSAATPAEPNWLDLYDYRRHVADLYRQRAYAYHAGADEQETLQRFRTNKDALFARHPQSAIAPDDRAAFTGLRYFPYAPELRVEATLMPIEPPAVSAEHPEEAPIEASGPHSMRFDKAATASFILDGVPATLTLYWIDVYGGGLFLAFRDATCPDESYGGGRYLFDTVKGSDILRLDDGGAHGYRGGRILLDFNYAYNLSQETQTATIPSSPAPILSVPGQHLSCS